MSGEEEELTKEEAYQIGRTLGWLKRKDKSLYEWISEVAEKKKIKPTDIIIEALKTAFLESEMQLDALTARQLLQIIRVWNELQREFLGYILDLVKVFWIEGFKKYTEIITMITEAAEEEKKEKKLKMTPEAIAAMPQMMMSALTTALSMIPQLQTAMQQIFTQKAEIKDVSSQR